MPIQQNIKLPLPYRTKLLGKGDNWCCDSFEQGYIVFLQQKT